MSPVSGLGCPRLPFAILGSHEMLTIKSRECNVTCARNYNSTRIKLGHSKPAIYKTFQLEIHNIVFVLVSFFALTLLSV